MLKSKRSLKGKRVLLTAGPTQEPWDAVRFLTNASSGRTGIALAEEAVRRGASVTLVLGPTRLEPHRIGHLKVIRVRTAREMLEAVQKNLSPRPDYFIASAAIVDYRPSQALPRKLKKSNRALTLTLLPNPDILAFVGNLPAWRRPGGVLGFALETDHLEREARRKLAEKGCDFIFANRLRNLSAPAGEGFLMAADGRRWRIPRLPKERLARTLWKHLLAKN